MRLSYLLLALLPPESLAAPSPELGRMRPTATKPAPCPRLDLHAAVRSGRPSCLGPALRHMDVNDRDEDGNSPLHNAIHAGSLPMARALVRSGADIRMYDFQGNNALRLAEQLGHARLARYFTVVERETQRLYDAVEANDVVAASSSLQRGASLGMRDIRADTLLHRAAQSNLPEMGTLLIHHGAKLEARNYLGETPLHAAALRDHYEFMRVLVEAGANVNALDERRRTPLDLGALREDPRVMRLLQHARAKRGSPASVEHDFTESGPPVYTSPSGSSY